MEEIGVRLRSAREARGISVEQVEEETKIRRKYIRALEAGLPHDLPGEVYLKGFLRTYGNYLGLDGPDLVEEYKALRSARRVTQRAAVTEEVPVGEPTLGGLANGAAPAAEAAEAKRPASPTNGQADLRRQAVDPGRRTQMEANRRLSAARGRQQRTSLFSILLLLAAVTIVVYLGWLIAGQFQPEGSNPEPTPPTAEQPGTGQVPAPAPVVPKPAETPPPKLPDPPKVTMTRGVGEQVLFTVPAKEVRLRLEFGSPERLWMQAVVDGKDAYNGFAVEGGVAGKPLEFVGASLRLRMGHMNGVSLVVNDQRFDQPLQKGPYTLVFQGQP